MSATLCEVRADRLAILVFGLIPGCLSAPDECSKEGQTRCHGNAPQTCTPPCAEFGCHWSWTGAACPEDSTCVNPADGTAFCALSANPDPNCGGVDNAYCGADGVGVECFAGYAVSQTICPSPTVCRDPRPYPNLPFCALSTSTDPRCDPDPGGVNDVTVTCDGRTLLMCEGGYVIGTAECAIACIQAEGFCSLSLAPDPRCAGISGYCDGDAAVTCTQGYPVSRQDCATTACVEIGGVSYCATALDASP